MKVWSQTADLRFPDPVLSANVYCSGRLCEVIHRVVKPFWLAWRRSDPERITYVWVMRYARCGEHLKVRLHASETHSPLLRERLESAQRHYFSYLNPPDQESPPRRRSPAPPIDIEDGTAIDYPDRSFLWTQYARSQISLGFHSLIGDDQYVAQLTRCLGCGTEILIGRLETDQNGHCAYLLQSSLFLEGLIAGLTVLPINYSERSLYLLYHRDSLLRYLRRRGTSSDGFGFMRKIVGRFDLEIAKLNREWRGLAKASYESMHVADMGAWSCDVAAWRSTLSDLVEYVTPLCRHVQLDPFAESPIFPVLFKVFHGFSNQIGIDQYNEAFLCHFLLAVTTEEEIRRRPVPLSPVG